MSGFMDFSIGSGDDRIGKKATRFKPEAGRTYRVSLAWFKDMEEEGTPSTDPDNLRFTGCERIYKPGVGYFLYKGPAYAEFGQPKQSVATVMVIWPTDKNGDLDAASFKNGTGWQVMPWIFSPDKYKDIGRIHTKFSLLEHDLSMTCTDATYHKMTFTPENNNLLFKLLEAKDETLREVAGKILADAKGVAGNIHRELARDLTVDEIREKLGDDVEGPVNGGGTGTTANTAKDVDNLLEGLLDG